MLKKLCFALALLLLTTGCSGLGLWLAVAGTLRERQPAPPPAQTVQAEAMPDAPAQPPASLWDPASLALSAREGRYRLNDPFGSGEELPLPAEVTEAAREGYGAYVLFVIQMADVKHLHPNDATDPNFAKALREAAGNGVQVLAMDCTVTVDSMTIRKPVPVVL